MQGIESSVGATESESGVSAAPGAANPVERRQQKFREVGVVVLLSLLASAILVAITYSLYELGHGFAASIVSGAILFVATLLILGLNAMLTRSRAQTQSAMELFKMLRRNLPRATFFARTGAGRYLWFIGRSGQEAARVQEQLEKVRSTPEAWTEAPPSIVVDEEGNAVEEDSLRIASAHIRDGVRPHKVDIASVDFGLGDTVEIGVHEDEGSTLENNPVIRGLLPMVSNRFRIIIYSADLQSATVYWTQERWKLGLGVSIESSAIYGCVHPDDAEMVRSVIEDCVEFRKNGSCVYRWTGPDAKELMQLATSYAPIFDEQGSFEGLLSISLDVGEEVQSSVADVNSFVVLEQLRRWFEHVPSYFFPVTSRLDTLAKRMDGLAQLSDTWHQRPAAMRENGAADTLRRVLETCRSLSGAAEAMRAELHNLSGSIQYMSNFLQDLETTYDLTSTPLAEPINNVVSALRGQLEDRGVTVQVAIEAERTSHSMGLIQPDSFQQALGSMLQNAIKFSPRGGVIDLVLRDDEREPKNFLVLEIADEGPAPDGGNYADLGRSHLIGSPIRSSKRDSSGMVVAAMSLSLQGISVQYEARPGGTVDENGHPVGLIGRLRVPRGG